MEHYIPTGNEFISIPETNEETGALESVNFLYMAQKGMIELMGDGEVPFLKPFVSVKNESGEYAPAELTGLSWKRESYWIPVMTAEAGGVRLTEKIITPLGQRGIIFHFDVEAPAGKEIRLGLCGRWARSVHRINQSKDMLGKKNAFISPWSHNMVLEFMTSGPLYAMSFMPEKDAEMANNFTVSENRVDYELVQELTLEPGQAKELLFYCGFGFEETAAVASAWEMRYNGWRYEYERTLAWLNERILPMKNEKLTQIFNVNRFFCIFFSTGMTLDTEQLVCVTSRSPRYYVSSAYWDRDTFLWAFPTLLRADSELARKSLEYVFTVQRRHIGNHSRYIDGTKLEPGFELDELMAPLIALCSFAETTGDMAYMKKIDDAGCIEEILAKLMTKKAPDTYLFETFQQPTDDLRTYPYLTYDNMLVWYALSHLAALLPEKYGKYAETAEKVRAAIMENCVFTDPDGKPYFGWSVDLRGNHDVYDEPPGSLQILPHYGFCSMEDEVWLNTVAKIRSPEYKFSFAGMPIAEIGCPHAPYPWLLSVCNSLLCGHEEQAWRELEIAEMDNGIACESFDAVNGRCMTGGAFATCAGFLCLAMAAANDKIVK